MESHSAILSCLKTYLRALQVFGLFPFDLEELKFSKIVLKFNAIKFCITLIVILVIFLMFGLNLWHASDYDDLYLAAYYWRVTSNIVNLILIVQILAQFLCNRRIVEVIENLMIFNNQMMQFGVSSGAYIKFQYDCKKVPLITIGMMCFLAGYCVIITYFSCTTKEGWKYFAFLHWGLTIELLYGYINVVQFFIFTWMISKGFECLESHLKTSASRLSTEKIQKVSILFNQLVQSINCINGSLCELLSPTLASTLINEVFFIYSLTIYHQAGNASYTFFEIVFCTFGWFAVHAARVVLISYSGSSVSSSHGSLKDFILNLINIEKSESLKNEMRCILFQIESGNKNLRNSFFDINWRLMFTVRLLLFFYSQIEHNNYDRYFYSCFKTSNFRWPPTVITYIIITFQFKDPSNPFGDDLSFGNSSKI